MYKKVILEIIKYDGESNMNRTLFALNFEVQECKIMLNGQEFFGNDNIMILQVSTNKLTANYLLVFVISGYKS